MNYLSLAPEELTFYWITGTLNPSDREALKIFLCSGVKLTCHELNQKVDRCWRKCLEVLAHNWKVSFNSVYSERLVYNWIMGKSQIYEHSLYDLLKNDYKLTFLPNHEEKILDLATSVFPIPRTWISLHTGDLAAYSRGINGDLSLIDLKNRTFLGEIQGYFQAYPLFNKETPPFVFKDKIFILFVPETQKNREIRVYSRSEKSIQYACKIPLPFDDIRSMHQVNDHIIFQLKNQFVSISFENLNSSDKPSFLYSETFHHILRVEKAFDKLLFFHKKDDASVHSHFLSIEDEKFKVVDCLAENHPFTKADLMRYCQAFHVKSGRFVFFYLEQGDSYRMGSISDKGEIFIHFETIQGLDKLVEYQDTVLVCSRDKANKIQIQTLELIGTDFKLEPLVIAGMLSLDHLLLISVQCFLDKLFLVSYFDSNPTENESNPEYHLIILNISTLKVESTHALGSLIIEKISCISSSFGKIHVMLTQNKTPRLLKIDYGLFHNLEYLKKYNI